ncbi:MAG: isoleucine--tRNA ligase [Coriobacteriales bacterium]|nr:isoleucine--tRNA ligase [Coriobacteriales bacterium]
MANDFRDSLNLPQTDFPMRANLAAREPQRLAHWEESDVYNLMLKKNEGHEQFILHDGPPYANGPIHIGHAMNKISKDIINRYWTMQGFQTPYVPGWDCHGQPIEHKVETALGTKKFRETPTAEIRKLCQEYAVANIDVQRKGFKRLGVMGMWNDPYLTFVHEYDAADIEIFKKIFDKGAIYRGRKPVHWCKNCHTALAEAEIEYGDEESPSIFVRFELTCAPQGLTLPADVIIWTTTPWTLPANQAVILNPDAEYVAIAHEGRAEIVAKVLAQKLCESFDWDYELVEGWTVCGKDLCGCTYKHPIFDGEICKIIYGDYVTLDDGTGAVHCAPGHGVDDYNVGMRFGIPIVMPVDDNGRFYVGEGLGKGGPFSGLDTDEANKPIIEFLEQRKSLILKKPLTHSYPHCWRCKNPVIFRATDQWFVSMDNTGLREEALHAINEEVTWYPAHAAKRIGSMVENRPDWCISRQRAWGVPIPSFTCATCGEKVMNDDTLSAVIALFKEKGSDAWFTCDPKEYLGDACECPACHGHDLVADRDILDVWWDSGVSHTAVLGTRDYLRFPADMYLEGSDQHRGWFQSSLLTSIGAYDVPPFKSVVSQGFTLDGQGRKMSKSLGNVIDPNKVCDTLGADVIRLWVSSTDTSADVSIDDEILKRVGEAYRHLRNTMRFLLSVLNDYDAQKNAIPVEELDAIDKLVLARACDVHAKVEEAYAQYRFNSVYRSIFEFTKELSNIYLDCIKDRMYCDASDSHLRRSSQTVAAEILSMLVRDLQPILAYTCDEVLEYMPESLKCGVEFAALLDWYKAPMDLKEAQGYLKTYETILEMRDAVKKTLEDGEISSSMEASVDLGAPQEILSILKESGVDTAELCIVSSLTYHEAQDFECSVYPATGEKCPRCRNIRTLQSDGLCCRCSEAVKLVRRG